MFPHSTSHNRGQSLQGSDSILALMVGQSEKNGSTQRLSKVQEHFSVVIAKSNHNLAFEKIPKESIIAQRRKGPSQGLSGCSQSHQRN
jgi:hypothetical protein